jgi:hypothetical protein
MPARVLMGAEVHQVQLVLACAHARDAYRRLIGELPPPRALRSAREMPTLWCRVTISEQVVSKRNAQPHALRHDRAFAVVCRHAQIVLLCAAPAMSESDGKNRAVINALRADLDHAGFSRPLREMISQPAETAVGAIGLVATAMGYAIDPSGPLSIAGLFAAAFPVAKELFRSLGYVPADYTGPQWPFLYAYGSPATKRNVTRLLNVLSEA